MRLPSSLLLVALALLACSPNPLHAGTVEVAVDNSKNGGTVKAHVSDTIRVTLDTTEWTFQPVSDSSILTAEGQQVVSPAPPGTCFPGMGCGSTTARFRVTAGGTSKITATRVSCGEARRCVGAEGMFEVDVIVS